MAIVTKIQYCLYVNHKLDSSIFHFLYKDFNNAK
jgi:hypothetical protein